MTLNCKGIADNLKKGLLLLEEYGFLQLGEKGISVTAVAGDETIIQKTKEQIIVTYDTELHFYMALARGIGIREGIRKITPKVKNLGFMLDCSRNAVPKTNTVKQLICLLILCGYDYLELYTEDTYEVPGEPYFGYMRGRFRASELKEIIAFADVFHFEIVPCIQTLAHLKNLAHWGAYWDIVDIDDILLVGEERTYELIRKCIRFCKDIFHTNRINIGTDEAFHLGVGKYLERNGYRPKQEIYLEHLKKVFEICKEEGFCPEFWGDAFYHAECDEQEVKALFDGTQTAICWTYTHSDKEFHLERFKKLKKYVGKVSYAGGLWKWLGYAPHNEYSRRVIDGAFAAAEEEGVDDILMTAWGDDGNECSVFAVIPSMWYAATKLYPCDTDEEKIIKELTGYSIQDWNICDRLNHVMPKIKDQDNRQNNAAKYLLHNDYLLGLLDYNIPDHAGEIYEQLLPQLKQLARRKSTFSYLFATYSKLAQVLTRKATFGKRLYRAYQESDFEKMQLMLEELRQIKRDMKKFYKEYRTQWMIENKSFGFEVMDVRIGGLISRADTVLELLEDYLKGETDKVYELEEKRIDYYCGRFNDKEKYAPRHNCWSISYTVNRIINGI